MDNSKVAQKKTQKFYCEKCDYFTTKTSSWKKHIETDKHQRLQWITKKLPKTDHHLFNLGRPNKPKIDQTCRKNRSKKSVKKMTLQNTAVLAQCGIFRRETLRFRGISG